MFSLADAGARGAGAAAGAATDASTAAAAASAAADTMGAPGANAVTEGLRLSAADARLLAAVLTVLAVLGALACAGPPLYRDARPALVERACADAAPALFMLSAMTEGPADAASVDVSLAFLASRAARASSRARVSATSSLSKMVRYGSSARARGGAGA